MVRKTLGPVLLGLGSLTGLALLGVAAPGGDRVPPKPAAATAAPANGAVPLKADMPKSVIESPTKRVIAFRSAPPARDNFTNPKVRPGKVRWHPDFAAACAAAAKSKKPVLLFQMMGKLDDQFC